MCQAEFYELFQRFLQLFKPGSKWMPQYMTKELEEKAAQATRSNNTTEMNSETQCHDNSTTDTRATITDESVKVVSDHNEDAIGQNGNANVLQNGNVHLESDRENETALPDHHDNCYQNNDSHAPSGNPVTYDNAAYDKDNESYM